MAWWAVLYALSMLARYHPAQWANRINVDGGGGHGFGQVVIAGAAGRIGGVTLVLGAQAGLGVPVPSSYADQAARAQARTAWVSPTQPRTAIGVDGVVAQGPGRRGTLPAQPVPQERGAAAGCVGAADLRQQRHS